MQLPFTVDQFFDVFRAYNTSVWPAQVLLIALAAVAIAAALFPRRWSGVAISAVLAVLWAWSGLAYHLAFFAAINPAAYVFAAVSLAGAGAFLWHGVVRRRLVFKVVPSTRTTTGGALIVFALVAYPAWSHFAGHPYPTMPTFGLPCPTTIFTVGMLSFLSAPYPRSPLVVPVLWCFVGAQAAVLFGVTQDLMLAVAAVLGIALLVTSNAATPPGRVLPEAAGSAPDTRSKKAG